MTEIRDPFEPTEDVDEPKAVAQGESSSAAAGASASSLVTTTNEDSESADQPPIQQPQQTINNEIERAPATASASGSGSGSGSPAVNDTPSTPAPTSQPTQDGPSHDANTNGWANPQSPGLQTSAAEVWHLKEIRYRDKYHDEKKVKIITQNYNG